MLLSKYITEVCTLFGNFLIVAVLIVLSFVAFAIFHQSATSFDIHALTPGTGLINNLSSLSILMFAMAGIEIVPTLANSVKSPHKTLPKGLLIAAFLIFFCYALSTIEMNIMATPDEIQKTTGLMSTFVIIGAKLHIPSLV